MGNLKSEIANNTSEDSQQHKLTDGEANYLRLLNLALQYHTLSGKIQSGYLYYVCTARLGYKPGVNLQFEFDFDNMENILIVKMLPLDAAEAAKAATEGQKK